MNGQELLNYKNWVVVGDVLNTEKYANTILNKLKLEQYNVAGVNPKDTSGEAFLNLRSVPYNIDVIDLCIHPSKGISIVKEAKEVGINKVLIQPGASSKEIIDYCIENNIFVVQSCVLVEISNRN